VDLVTVCSILYYLAEELTGLFRDLIILAEEVEVPDDIDADEAVIE